ncbi:MAG: DNA adenine methylase [Micrococcales bacterium]|nr:DNA adenine methylase [Micrococcales bacterium]
MIKYLGSKRRLVPALGELAAALGARTAVDLFTGTTRVAQEFKRRGLSVIASDIASYSGVLSDCYIATDRDALNPGELATAISELTALPGRRGYVTTTFCEESRFFHPKNGARIDAMRDAIEERYRGSALYPVLLTALMLAADKVDSTTGVQMAFLKQWAPRALKDLVLVAPTLLPGVGTTVLGDAAAVVSALPPVDLMYLDPPYNQHRYFTNYHIWETLVRWDAPEHYGVACKREDCRAGSTKSDFNVKALMPAALRDVIVRARAEMLVVSFSDEGWISAGELETWLGETGREEVTRLDFDSPRYVGARIGVFNPSGEKVGRVSHVRNTEHLFLAGPREAVNRAASAVRERCRPDLRGSQALGEHQGELVL